MKRAGANDTDPNPVDKTDPIGTSALDATQPMGPAETPNEVDLDDEEVERLIRALERQPRRPPPVVDERASSDGGAFVAYTGSEHVPPRALSSEEHRGRVQVELAALAGVSDRARKGGEEGARGPRELVDTHVLPGRRRRGAVVPFMVVSAAVVVGVAGAIGLARSTTVASGTTAASRAIDEPSRPKAVDEPSRSIAAVTATEGAHTPTRVEVASPPPAASSAVPPFGSAPLRMHARAPSRSAAKPASTPDTAPSASGLNPEVLLLPDHP